MKSYHHHTRPILNQLPVERYAFEPSGGTSNVILASKVYKKVSGEKATLHKFLVRKTNKEQSECYPAYVIFHTDFSSGRKEMIKHDMAYSDYEQQIRDILAAEIADNVTEGKELSVKAPSLLNPTKKTLKNHGDRNFDTQYSSPPSPCGGRRVSADQRGRYGEISPHLNSTNRNNNSVV